MVRILSFYCPGPQFSPWSGNKIIQATHCSQINLKKNFFKEIPIVQPSHCVLRVLPKNENVSTQRCYTNVCRSFSGNNPKLETTQISTIRMDKQIWYIHTTECYSAVKRNKGLIHTTWMNFKIIMLSERRPKRVYSV